MTRIILTVVGILALALAVLVFVNRPQLMIVDAEPPRDFPQAGFAHDVFERLLRKYVDFQGNVDYAAWHAALADRRALGSYLAAVGRYSPDATPERFPASNDALAYWIYAYNAYVIWSILQQWPIESVTDVKAPLEIVTGLGFFYRQRFVFGGEPYSLYAVENDRIRGDFRDPRIHFVLNCASESCPVLRPELPVGDALEELLQRATLEFVTDERNVRIDYDARSIVLSTIFRWFRRDFDREMQRRGLPSENGPLDYVIMVAPEPLKSALLDARSYEIRYAEYDWSLNDKTHPDPAGF